VIKLRFAKVLFLSEMTLKSLWYILSFCYSAIFESPKKEKVESGRYDSTDLYILGERILKAAFQAKPTLSGL
jgi:hypothetical protein